MSIDEFWYEDIDVYYAYVEAYENRIHYQSWISNVYTRKAVEVAIHNVMPQAIGVVFGSGNSDYTMEDYFEKPLNTMDDTEIEFNNTPQDEVFMDKMKSINELIRNNSK